MALSVRPDDEVYQFDTVWLGPDEYTLPIQARYVAWGTWLACFLVAAALLIPIGGHGPGGVLGSLMWAIAVSVVAARAVMLIVDHERPLRSLPQLFGAEARAALAATRGGERSLLVRPGKVRVREVPEKVLRRRERERQAARRRTERKAAHAARRRGGGRTGAVPGTAIATYPSETRSGPVWSGTVVPPDWEGPVLTDQQWTPGQPPIGYAQPEYQQPEYQQPEYARAEFAPTGYPQAGYPQAAYPEAGYPEGGYAQAGHAQTAYPQAEYPQAAYPQAAYPETGYAEAEYPQAGYPEAGYPQAAYPEPEAEYPDGGYPEAGHPHGTYPDQTVAAPPSVDGATGADVDGRLLLPARRVR